ncbi:MAG: cyclopropane-fatty-acyl-phospholipid synthase family protein [Gammaproteobacteria bacterium]
MNDNIVTLEKKLRHGQLTLHLPPGRVETFGNGPPYAEWIVHSPATLRRIARDPEMMLGETYMNGEWDVPQGRLAALLEVLMANFSDSPAQARGILAKLLKNIAHHGNGIMRSYRNVAHHYDLDEWVFRRFLDQDMQYSCAYFYAPNISLDEAQRAKCRHIMNKLMLSPGQHVLDIGCGWGGLALFLAEHARVRVTGLTLSREQLRVATHRAAERGLQNLVEFRLQDYREHTGSYDRIVSVGMFEHVGAAHYDCYFTKLRHLLRPDGAALLHTIGRVSPPGDTNPWIQKYIFPGGYNPALSEVTGAIEKSGLISCDVEVLRLHYALTLEAWYQRFQQHRDEVAARMGERFCRMWEFYLASCEASFRWRDLVVFQIQLAHRLDALPLTRDYLYEQPAQRASTAVTSRLAS